MKWVLPKTYTNPIYPFKRPLDLDSENISRYKVAIIGAGPVGLSAALDLANRGIPSVVFSKEETVSIGSRALCFSKKCLEVVHRINPRAVSKMLNKGVTWNLGKVFYKDDEVYNFNLLPENGHKIPAFINLQQYYFEEYLVDEINKNSLIDLRWYSKANYKGQDDEKATLKIETPKGNYSVEAEYILACDGVHSPTRNAMNLSFEGELFEENFLIADITMENDFPTERWFWFDPPFNKGYSALLHKEPDGVWRIDLQLGWEGIDKDKELDQDRIKERLRKMLGDDCKFELEWTSIYNFRCMRMKEFVHDRVIFAGDSAHQVSPFGARGANGGVQDIDNLIWKLAYVIQNKAPKSLLHSYQEERSPATDENIYHSSNATDFISPKSEISLLFRNQTLELAKVDPFAQKLVNSGRLSDAYKYLDSKLTVPDTDNWNCSLQPGYSFKDVLVNYKNKNGQLIDILKNEFNLLIFSDQEHNLELNHNIEVNTLRIPEKDNEAFASRYDAQKDTWYLLRPDQYIVARGKMLDRKNIQNALDTALGKKVSTSTTFIEDKNPKYIYDKMYQQLIKAHEGLSEDKSHQLNARLILKLMQQCRNNDEWSSIIASVQ